MWRTRSHAAVFVPRSPEGSRVAYSRKQVDGTATVLITAQIRLERMAPSSGEVTTLKCAGALRMRGPEARLLFRPTTEVGPSGVTIITTESPCVPEPPSALIPARIVRGACHERPHVWIEFMDQYDRSLVRLSYLGRPERKPLDCERSFVVPASVTVWISARELDPRRGPIVDLSGELTFPHGAEMVIRLASERDRLGEPAGQMEFDRIPVLAPGASFPIAGSEVSPGAAGNPEVSVLLRDFAGAVARSETEVGRCVRLV